MTLPKIIMISAIIILSLSVGYFKGTLMLSGGVCANLLFSAALLPAELLLPSQVRHGLIFSSLVYAALNILPVKSLDGGRILDDLLSGIFSYGVSARICSVVSGVTLFIVSSFSVLLFYYSAFNFTLLFFVMYLFYSTVLLTDR